MKSLESGHEMQTKLMSTAHVWPTLAWTLSQEMTLGWWSSLIFRAQRNLPNISDTLVTRLTWQTSVSLMMTSMWSALEETTAVYLCGDVCKCQKPLLAAAAATSQQLQRPRWGASLPLAVGKCLPCCPGRTSSKCCGSYTAAPIIWTLQNCDATKEGQVVKC